MLRATRFVTQVPRTNYLQRCSTEKTSYVQRIEQLEKFKKEQEKNDESAHRANLAAVCFFGGIICSMAIDGRL